jgi:microcystin synthetase protein McyG
VGNLSIYSCFGQPLIKILGFRCRGLGGCNTEQLKLDESYQYRWQQSRLTDLPQVKQKVCFLPDSAQIFESIKLDDREKLDGMACHLNDLAIAYIINAFNILDCVVDKDDSLSINKLIADFGVQKKYRQLLFRFFQILEQENYVQIQTPDTAIVLQSFSVPELNVKWSETLAKYAGAFAELTLIRVCGEKLAAVLVGEQDPLQLIFPEGGSTIAEHFYSDSPAFKPYNHLMQMALEKIIDSLPCGKSLRILEIGAGTGGMTTYLLNLFAEERIEYFFTDISNTFFSNAEQRFKEFPFINYQTLNIEKDIQQQGFELNSFDIVLASNVLHATENIAIALDNIHALLSTSGLFLFLEIEKKHPWIDGVFGLLDGWWRFADTDLRPDHPLISRTDWKNILQTKGFLSPTVLPDSPNRNETNQILVIAQAKDYITQQADVFSDIAKIEHKQTKHWLIFADRTGVASVLS